MPCTSWKEAPCLHKSQVSSWTTGEVPTLWPGWKWLPTCIVSGDRERSCLGGWIQSWLKSACWNPGCAVEKAAAAVVQLPPGFSRGPKLPAIRTISPLQIRAAWTDSPPLEASRQVDCPCLGNDHSCQLNTFTGNIQTTFSGIPWLNRELRIIIAFNIT